MSNLEGCCVLFAGKEVLKDEQFLETIIQGVLVIRIFYVVEKHSIVNLISEFCPCFSTKSRFVIFDFGFNFTCFFILFN